MDYSRYSFSRRELVQNISIFLALDAALSYLFYDSVLPFLLALILLKPFLKFQKQEYCRKRRAKLAMQFLDGMQAVSSALTAGYSVETAFRDACAELEKIYTEKDMIMMEFRYISAQLGINRSLEELLNSLAERSGVEDIRNFAEIFAVSKRSGGNLIAIIRNTVQAISQKEETHREIETALASKKMEQGIMSLVPMLILFYIQLVSPGFLDVMYHNALGVTVMTISLAVYAGAYYWGRKIVEIQV
ncbi:MAG: type II secretion system F family protein [Eubacteriales bacterium]|nr:type II secretion system F family protein [Eubacteriales bacterium]